MSDKWIFSIVRIYKFKSVLFKTFITLVALTMVLSASFYFSFTKLIHRELDKQVYETNMNLLLKTENTFNVVLDYVDQIMISTSCSPNTISAVIAPGLEKTSRNFDLIKYLSEITSSSELIDRITLYVDFDGTVFSSDGVATRLDGFVYKEMINQYNEQLVQERHQLSDQTTTSLQLYNDHICLFREFPLQNKNRNGLLIFELNPQILFRKIIGSDNDGIYIYDPEGNPAFSTEMDYTVLDPDVNGLTQTKNRSNIIYFISPLTGWMFFYPMDLSNLKNVYVRSLILTLPVLLFSLIICLLFSLSVVYNVYRPIRKLMTLASGNAGRISHMQLNAQNEFEFLGMAYADARAHNERLSHLIERSTETILGQFFSKIILGQSPTEDEAKELLEDLKAHFQVDQQYAAFAVELIPNENVTLNRMQTDVYCAGIRTLIEKRLSSQVYHYCLSLDTGKLAVIFAFPSTISIASVRKELAQGREAIEEEMRGLPLQTLVCQGSIYNNVCDLFYSYREAQKKLQYQMYLGKTFEEYQVVSAEENQDTIFLKERVQQFIISLAEHADMHTLELLDRILNDVSKYYPEHADALQFLHYFVDKICEEAIVIRAEEGVLIEQKEELFKILDTLEDRDQINDFVRTFCAQIIDIFSAYNNKCRSRYVLRAKEYIELHYADSTLSLNEVAEQINISPSYLSKIFKQYQNQNFIDYLNEFRVRKSKLLLDTTTLSVREIGFKSGFSTPQNFNRVFKKYEKVTPGQYKERHL